MPSEITAVSASEMVPQAVSQAWPEMVPVHGVTLVVGLRPSGQQALHVLYNSDAPPWVLIGLLETVRQDLIAAWQDEAWSAAEEGDDD